MNQNPVERNFTYLKDEVIYRLEIENSNPISSNKLILITKSLSQDLPGIIVEANDKACNILGYSKNILCSMSFYDLIDIEDIGILETKSKKLIEKEYISYTLNLYTKDEKKIRLFLDSYLISSEEEIIELIIAEEENELLNKEKYDLNEEKRIFDFSSLQNSGVATLLVDKDMTILNANQELQRLTGYNYHQIRMLSLFDLLRKDFFGEKYSENIFLDEDTSDFPIILKSVLIDKYDNHRYVQLFIGKIEDEFFIITILDITDQNILQTALRKSEEKFRTLFNIANDMIFLYPLSKVGIRGNFVEVNSKACEILGYSRDELLSLTLNEIVKEEYEGQLKEYAQNLLSLLSDSTFEDLNNLPYGEGNLITKSNEIIFVEYSISIFEYENEYMILIVVRDITEKRDAEFALRESEEKYRQIFENALDMIFVVSHDFKSDERRFIDVNNTACKTLGYTREEFLQMNPFDIIAQESFETLIEIQKKIKQREKVEGEMITLTKAGDKLFCEFTSNTIELKDQTITINISRNITDKRKAEQSLKRTEEKYAHLFENVLDMIIISERIPGTLFSVFVDANKKALEKFGYSKEEFLQLNPLDLIAEENLAIFEEIREEVVSKKKVLGELLIKNKVGEKILIEFSSTLMNIEEKEYLYIISRDISEKKEIGKILE